jgi:prepilin-type N-terminal cleavage/methylation domain-containing protein
MKTNNKKSGFTLVELAIVLVIIGLIIGGVLVGQDLIKAATIRATVTDLEKFNAAATTFRGKYSGLPGDLAARKSYEFNFSTSGDANAAGTRGNRDGNGILESDGTELVFIGGENALFWKDLGVAALIGGQYTAIGAAALATTPAITSANVSEFLPKARLRDSANFHVYSDVGRNYFYIGTLSQTLNGAALTVSDGVTPLEALGIDEKLDDGVPDSGVVIGITGAPSASAEAAAAAGVTVCAVSTTPASYNVSTATTGAPSNVVCQLAVRTSF